MSAADILYKIPVPYACSEDHTVEVYGEPEMGWYEWRIVRCGRVERDSQCRGYGCAEIALRDGLIAASEGL